MRVAPEVPRHGLLHGGVVAEGGVLAPGDGFPRRPAVGEGPCVAVVDALADAVGSFLRGPENPGEKYENKRNILKKFEVN